MADRDYYAVIGHGWRTVTAGFPNLVDETPDALVAVSPSRIVLAWNRGAQSMFGFTAAEAVGRSLDELIVPSERLREARRFTDEAIGCGSVVYETIRHRKDGTSLCVDVALRAVERPDAEPYLAVSKMDVSRMRAERRGNLLAKKLSHELRTPLNGIIGFAKLLHDGKVGRL